MGIWTDIKGSDPSPQPIFSSATNLPTFLLLPSEITRRISLYVSLSTFASLRLLSKSTLEAFEVEKLGDCKIDLSLIIDRTISWKGELNGSGWISYFNVQNLKGGEKIDHLGFLSRWVRTRDTLYFPKTIRENQWADKIHPLASCLACGEGDMECDIKMHNGEEGWDADKNKRELKGEIRRCLGGGDGDDDDDEWGYERFLNNYSATFTLTCTSCPLVCSRVYARCRKCKPIAKEGKKGPVWSREFCKEDECEKSVCCTAHAEICDWTCRGFPDEENSKLDPDSDSESESGTRWKGCKEGGVYCRSCMMYNASDFAWNINTGKVWQGTANYTKSGMVAADEENFMVCHKCVAEDGRFECESGEEGFEDDY
ncbi:hypothetical protein TrCOL_g2232 [Triparma columacea]|uniref:F-box domain-containing protein n=1 Tax=Triparma columacea TaxID=722753 RepID=A0A9W7L412_9STRA|nr:hypothetical protein TrCOL_g2232 [Triparma columacea]